jgi:hypothetical protein
MERVNKIKKQDTSIQDTINKEDISIKKQRLVIKINEENGYYKEID